jgi:hypothetical protein
MHPRRHRLAACLLVLAALLAPVPAWAAPDKGASEESQLYKRLLKSTVLVLSFEPGAVKGGRVSFHEATGWVVDVKRRLVVTNYHVVKGQDHFAVCFPSFIGGKLVTERSAYVGSAVRGGGISAKVVVANEQRDLAVLKLELKMPHGVLALPLAKKEPRPRQTVYSIGNPGSAPQLWRFFVEKVAEVGQRRFDSYRPGSKEPFHHDARVIQVHLPANVQGRGPGESGGPLVSPAGELLGVTQGGDLARKPPFVTYITVLEVKTLLKAKGLLPAPEPEIVAQHKPKPVPAQEAASHRDEPSPDAEAEVQLKLAQQLADAGRTGPARTRLQALITKYPKSEAAKDAQKLLDQLKE